MTDMNTYWQKIDRTDNVQEYFCLGEFIQSDKWNGSSHPVFEKKVFQDGSPRIEYIDYRYCKDGFEYRGISYTFDNEIHVTEVTHATSFESMCSIIEEGGFRSNRKYCPGIGHMSLVWFGLKIGEKEIDSMKENSKRELQALMADKPLLKADNVLSQIAITPAFQPMSLYGHFKFTIGIQEVLQAYAIQFCAGSYPEMRKLGTFAYKQEIMHVILFCPPGTPGTDNCPILSDDPVIQPDETLETWTWKPHSTGNQYISFINNGFPRQNNIRWEHVSLAFYVQDCHSLKMPDLDHRVSLCLQRMWMWRWTISGVDEDICYMLDLIETMDATIKKSLANMLISMIAGYLIEERLYEKTMGINYSSQEYVRVNLELVVQRLRELLETSDFDALNWSPLTRWVDSLTKHSNVLHVIPKACIQL